ncbi:hypothetical protein BpHYR1_024491 [Brachionus plicatilis]|uniref:Uncharacterized protein n=1 Tax=Brachionus plicatilis TaxID=10195 RepID=A0A3M7P220_BRAPC|nr:hypothetical protein BpHYR1_024491 [Brachionus plicatilis]
MREENRCPALRYIKIPCQYNHQSFLNLNLFILIWKIKNK